MPTMAEHSATNAGVDPPVFCGDVDASMIAAEEDEDETNESNAPPPIYPSGDDDDDEAAAAAEVRRQGTVASARFNMLSTMVGGGSLSLPLAFYKSGNGLVGPLMLIVVALLTEFCFRVHVGSARLLAPSSTAIRGHDSFESVASRALGSRMNAVSMALVTAMCFFGTVGYAVLLRDMLQPVTDALWHPQGGTGDAGSSSNSGRGTSGPSLPNNLTMLSVVLIMTPLCTLKTLTALQRFGAASMLSVLVLGGCVVYRSLQCNYHLWLHPPSIVIHGGSAAPYRPWDAFELLPHSWKDLLDVFPLYVSCFVCHYNLLPVHNDFKHPTAPRVGYWIRSTVWSATAFYMVMGLSGSAYGRCAAAMSMSNATIIDGDELVSENCTSPAGHTHDDAGAGAAGLSGNILLDFPEDDPLLLVGRMCLAVTLALAFPMLTIPARDIVLRCIPNNLSFLPCFAKQRPRQQQQRQRQQEATPSSEPTSDLTEPLLVNGNCGSANDVEAPASLGAAAGASEATTPNDDKDPPFLARLGTAILVFWSAAAVASCVSSIDVVWDLLGSSLSILLSYLIPCAAYLSIKHQRSVQVRPDHDEDRAHDLSHPRWSPWLARAIIAAFVPLMVGSTANAVYNTFFRPRQG